ncbi:hypothetical protein BDZ97DRAFT_1786298 [Flammula alnicola]|nr:hypothetical protein BDZ97DRAFT_1786298 [Flammula alnicola]
MINRSITYVHPELLNNARNFLNSRYDTIEHMQNSRKGGLVHLQESAFYVAHIMQSILVPFEVVGGGVGGVRVKNLVAIFYVCFHRCPSEEVHVNRKMSRKPCSLSVVVMALKGWSDTQLGLSSTNDTRKLLNVNEKLMAMVNSEEKSATSRFFMTTDRNGSMHHSFPDEPL